MAVGENDAYVIGDLGCCMTISTVRLRNTNNGDGSRWGRAGVKGIERSALGHRRGRAGRGLHALFYLPLKSSEKDYPYRNFC